MNDKPKMLPVKPQTHHQKIRKSQQKRVCTAPKYNQKRQRGKGYNLLGNNSKRSKRKFGGMNKTAGGGFYNLNSPYKQGNKYVKESYDEPRPYTTKA